MHFNFILHLPFLTLFDSGVTDESFEDETPGIFDESRASGVQNYTPGNFDNYLHHWVDATAGGRFASPVVNT